MRGTNPWAGAALCGNSGTPRSRTYFIQLDELRLLAGFYWLHTEGKSSMKTPRAGCPVLWREPAPAGGQAGECISAAQQWHLGLTSTTDLLIFTTCTTSRLWKRSHPPDCLPEEQTEGHIVHLISINCETEKRQWKLNHLSGWNASNKFCRFLRSGHWPMT